MRFSPDGKTLEVFRLPVGGWVSDFSSSRLELWEVATGRQRCQCPMWSFSRTWAFTPDGKAFVWMEPGGQGLPESGRHGPRNPHVPWHGFQEQHAGPGRPW